MKPLVETEIAPVDVRRTPEGALFVAFERAAFGTLTVRLPGSHKRRSLVAHFGEKLDAAGRVDRHPPGSIRYRRVEQGVAAGKSVCRFVIPPDKRNTGPAAIKMPASIGEVLPFRYVEIEDGAGLTAADIRQVAVHYPFDDNAAAFHCSSEVLNAVWDLCKYSIKATTFCGVYVDGDRERIPYEGDAYINQLGHYGVDHEYAFARHSHEYMIQHPTWCTEWHLHSVLMAWMDYLYTGETVSLETFYDDLCAKTLIDFARADGLISVAPEMRSPAVAARVERHFQRGIIRRDIRDVVDWPPGSFTAGGTGERDNHEMLPVNTVVNAFHCRALRLMSRIAQVTGRGEDHERFTAAADRVQAAINRQLFDARRGVYVDGENSRHASLHSNLFMLAFDLVPEARRRRVLDFVKSRGMACSVYGAQHLLDALYRHGEAAYALELMTARHDRSWWNMLQVGSTITLEAWDLRYKNNLDWNHAWGAAPANIIPRWLLGVRPVEAGFAQAVIEPQLGALTEARGQVPSVLGPIGVSVCNHDDEPFEMQVDIPPGMTARLVVPQHQPQSNAIVLDGQPLEAQPSGKSLVVDPVPPGRHTLTVDGKG